MRLLSCAPIAAAFLFSTSPASAPGQQAPTIQRLLTIGCEDCGDARQFSTVLDVDINARGDVLVVDRDAPILRLFDQTGRLLWSGGRKGSGPGEYRLPIRGKLLEDGSMIVVDMQLKRITVIAPDRTVRETVPVDRFVGQVAITARGNVAIGSDDFRGLLHVLRWAPGQQLRTVGTVPVGSPAAGGTITMPSLALSSSGQLASLATPDYVIALRDSSMRLVRELRRDVAPIRRTPAEEAVMTERIGGRGQQAAGAERDAARSSTPILPDNRDRSLKPHFKVDALRFDTRDRLWVQTMRGNESSTVVDLFAANGQFIAALTIPHVIGAFAVAHDRMVAAVESGDGIPQVMVWSVR